MNRQHLHAEIARRLNGSGDGGRDIVEFKIQKNLRAAGQNRAHDFGAFRGVELQADLKKRNLFAQLLDQSERLFFCRDIERNNDFVSRFRHLK